MLPRSNLSAHPHLSPTLGPLSQRLSFLQFRGRLSLKMRQYDDKTHRFYGITDQWAAKSQELSVLKNRTFLNLTE